MLVEGKIGHQPFEPGLLLFHLPEPTQSAHTEVRVLLFPGVEGGFTDAQLPTEVADRSATLGLPDGIDDLLFGECRPLHRSTPFARDRRSRHHTLV